jgi:hypothetical protein
MKKPLSICGLSLVLVGCAPANYLYSFDLTDPGAVNFADARRPDVQEDADVKAEIRLDPTEFRAIALDITNKTDTPLQVQWDQIALVSPDGLQRPMRPQAPLGAVEPGAKLPSLLAPFELPSQGAAAKVYDGSTFELVVPMIVRGMPREVRYHLRATLKKL